MQRRAPSSLLLAIVLLSACGFIAANDCTASVDCEQGFDCVRGRCFNLDTVRINPIPSLNQMAAPANVRMAFSMYAERQNQGCEPISFLPEQWESQILNKLKVYENGEEVSSSETFQNICLIAGGKYRLNVMVLVDQSDSQGANRATSREAVKAFAGNILGLSDEFQGGIRFNVAGFDGRPTFIPWTNGFLTTQTQIDTAVDNSAGGTPFTSTDLYSPYIQAIGVLEGIPTIPDTEDVSVLVVFTDGTDRARRITLADVEARINAATKIDSYFAVTVTGESATEFQAFQALAGRDLNVAISADISGLNDAFKQIADTITSGSGNVFALLHCSALRTSEMTNFHLTYGSQGDAQYFRGDTSVFNTGNVNQCDAAAVEAHRTNGCLNIALTDAQRQGSCSPPDPATELTVRTGPMPTTEPVECVWVPCPERACASGYECLEGYCVDMSTLVAKKIDHSVSAPSNVLVAFSILGAMQDGTCGPVAFPPDRYGEVEQLIKIRENEEDASSTETFSGLSNLLRDTHFRVMLLVDRSLSLSSQTGDIRNAVLGFVREVFAKPELQPALSIASFDGTSTLVSWTNNQFLDNQADLEDAVNNAVLEASQTSTNLYAAYLQALTVLEAVPSNSFSDFTALVVFSDGSDRARRNTLQQVRNRVSNTVVFALMSVYITGEVGVEAADFLEVVGRDGKFRASAGAGQVDELNSAFKAIAWQLNARARSTYVYLYCSAVRAENSDVNYELTFDDNTPMKFSYNTGVFDTTVENNQCREAMATTCVGCDAVLDLSTADGRTKVTQAQTCNDCSSTPGYTGGLCEDNVNECSQLTTTCDLYRGDRCHENAVCVDTEGSFRCECQNDLVGNGIDVCKIIPVCGLGLTLNSQYDCVDVNECALSRDNCNVNALCTNTLGSFTCECLDPRVGDGVVTCDIDECTENLDNCHSNAECIDTDGSFTCRCNSGYTGTGVACDLDRCLAGAHNCHEEATCTDNLGSFTCACRSGWDGDGVFMCDRDDPDIAWWQWLLIGLAALLALLGLCFLLSRLKCEPAPTYPKPVYMPEYYTIPPPIVATPPPMEVLVPKVSYRVNTFLVPAGAPIPGSAMPMSAGPMDGSSVPYESSPHIYPGPPPQNPGFQSFSGPAAGSVYAGSAAPVPHTPAPMFASRGSTAPIVPSGPPPGGFVMG